MARIVSVLLLGLIVSSQLCFIMAGVIAPLESTSQNSFAANLFSVIVENKTSENVVYSPASIQTCLALASMGAGGQTAMEMRDVLKLGQEEKIDIAKKYAEFLKTFHKESKSSDDDPQLKMANRIYVNERLNISTQFNEIAGSYFNSEAEKVNFGESSSVDTINKWVEQQTQNKIKNLMKPNSVDSDTSAVLVNAIYFKAKWLRPFSQHATRKSTFKLNADDSMEVDTMYSKDDFGYADLPELDATALEMPYKNSNISMLIILPKKIDGLKELESKLKGMDLNKITSQIHETDVEVHLPKFRIEFDIDLNDPLNKMGLCKMFTSEANFSGLFESATPQRISEVKHKAFLDVNEAGSEAAAATYIKVVPLSLNLNQKVFIADHPFVFAIRSQDAVYFAGHVVKL